MVVQIPTLSGPTRRAEFIARPNRFVVRVRLGGAVVQAHLPNSGRLGELLLPGAFVILQPVNSSTARLQWKVTAVEHDRRTVMVDTHASNDVAEHLVRTGRIDVGHDVRGIDREVNLGRSRFDMVARGARLRTIIEVKSCTRFSSHLAMFPDAATVRGARHVRHLAALASRTRRAAIAVLVQSPKATHFLPDYHTDPVFAATLHGARKKIDIVPLALGWRADLSLDTAERIDIPWEVYEREAGNRGCYLLVLRLRRGALVSTGRLGRVRYKAGYYIYVGSAMQNLSQRIARHRRLHKALHWHIDYLRQRASVHASFPIVACDRLECDVAERMSALGQWCVRGFGCSDCSCDSHIFGFERNPLLLGRFWHALSEFRMERLISRA